LKCGCKKKRILVAKKRVTHSVPQAPHVDGKVSTCPGEICKVQTKVTIGFIIGLADIPLPVLNIYTMLQQLLQDFPQQ
jgi:hypothetical protein